MRIFTTEQLSDALTKHSKWLKKEPGGERANLSSADLSSADLRSANLRYTNLSSADLSSANLRYANLSYANLSSADLSYANLSSADLSSANLSSANLRSANLRYANLSSADLSYANLSSANLSSANLSSADLSSADLSYANLSSANLSSADLSSADLSYANLSSANLSSADLSSVKEDFFNRLSKAKEEVTGLFDAIVRGKVDGSHYEGECACFCGTIANLRKESYISMSIDLRPDLTSPTEKWFLGINKGDTPANNQVSKLTYEWMKEFMKENNIKRPRYKLVSSFDLPYLWEK